MSIIRRFAARLVAGVVVVLIGLAITAGAESIPQLIVVLQVKGQARYSSDNKTWNPLKKGEVLQPGTLVQTAERSVVDLQLGDQDVVSASFDGPDGVLRTPDEIKANTVRLYENSVLDIGKLTSDHTAAGKVSETQLDLRSGRIMGGVRKSSAASLYEIKFPKGVTGVREGIFLMKSSGELNVLYGMAMVALGSADEVKTVSANHQFDPSTGRVTEIRSPLPVEPVSSDQGTTAAVEAHGSSAVQPPSQGAGLGGALRKF